MSYLLTLDLGYLQEATADLAEQGPLAVFLINNREVRKAIAWFASESRLEAGTFGAVVYHPDNKPRLRDMPRGAPTREGESYKV